MQETAHQDDTLCHSGLLVLLSPVAQVIQELADKSLKLMAENSMHPSIRLKKVGVYWSARVGLYYRALARDRKEGLIWFWIGNHEDYNRLIRV